MPIAGSSNGRTTASGAVYLGSNPGPAALSFNAKIKYMEKSENKLERFNPELVEPSAKYKTSYLEALEEYQLIDGEDPDVLEERSKNFDSFLEEVDKNKKGLIVENVPQIKYWCVEGDKYIGNINYRPNLNEKLKFKGGNIGYSIRPSERGKGYASFMLTKILEKARADKIPAVILTCDDDNLASMKVIEKAGGERIERDTENGKSFSRYVIKLD